MHKNFTPIKIKQNTKQLLLTHEMLSIAYTKTYNTFNDTHRDFIRTKISNFKKLFIIHFASEY